MFSILGPILKKSFYSRMKGGEAVAAGSQGCVFVPKLVLNESTGKAKTSDPKNSQVASKVFSNVDVYDDERMLLDSLSHVSNEGIITLAPGSFAAPHGLNDENKESASKLSGPACKKIAGEYKSAVYVMQMPLIDGDLQRPTAPKPITFMTKAYNALMRMKHNGIVHGDMAPRNIFFKGDDALIGDFGYSINFRDPNNETNGYRRAANKYRGFKSSNPEHITEALDFILSKVDQITIEACTAVYIYENWENKDAIVNEYLNSDSKIQKRIEDGKYDINSPGLDFFQQQGIVVINDVRRLENLTNVIQSAQTNAAKEAFWPVVKNELLLSDIKRFTHCLVTRLDIHTYEKYNMVEEIICNSNFLYFYRYTRIPEPDDIKVFLSEAEIAYTIIPPEVVLTNEELIASTNQIFRDMTLKNLESYGSTFVNIGKIKQNQLKALIRSKKKVGGRRRTTKRKTRHNRSRHNRKH